MADARSLPRLDPQAGLIRYAARRHMAAHRSSGKSSCGSRPRPRRARRSCAAGATPLRGRRLQEDCLLDTADERLRQRAVRPPGPDGGRAQPAHLQGPGPASPDGSCAKSARRSSRDGETMPLHPRAPRLLGLVPVPEVPRGVRRDRRRHRARRDAHRHVRRDRGQRGGHHHRGSRPRPPEDYLVDSYRGLYVQHCEAKGMPVGDMVFDE